MLDPCLYNEDPTYLKIVTYFCFIWPIIYIDAAQAQNCFRENLLNFFSQKHTFTSTHSMTDMGVTTVPNELYFVHLHVSRKPFIVNYDVLLVVEWVEVGCS